MCQIILRVKGFLLFTLVLGLTSCVTTPVTPLYSPASHRNVDVKVEGGISLGERMDWAFLAGQDPQKGGKKIQPLKPKEKASPKTPEEEQEEEQEEGELLTIKFGPNIFVDPVTKKITKLYPLPQGLAVTVLTMMKPPPKGKPKNLFLRMLGNHTIVVEQAQNLDRVMTGKLVHGQMGRLVAGNDIIIVEADSEGLAAFEKAFNFLFNNIPQVDIQIKVVESNFSDSLDIGLKPVGTSPTIIRRGSNPEKMFIQSFSGNFPNQTALGAKNPALFSEGLFTIGGIHDEWELKAILEVLQTQLSSDVISQPHVVVRNGGVATVSSLSEMPYPEAKVSGLSIVQTIKFKKVGVTMNIRPTISGTEMIILEIDIKVDSIATYADTDPVDTPIVSSRKTQTTVHIQSGKTISIGGLITETTRVSESKVPILGDIPLVGLLFRNTFKENIKNEVMFLITPRILQKGESELFDKFVY